MAMGIIVGAGVPIRPGMSMYEMDPKVLLGVPVKAFLAGRDGAGRLRASESRLAWEHPAGDVVVAVPWSRVRDARVVFAKRGRRTVPAVEVDVAGEEMPLVFMLPGFLRQFPPLAAVEFADVLRRFAVRQPGTPRRHPRPTPSFRGTDADNRR